jgi:hypothetical protein
MCVFIGGNGGLTNDFMQSFFLKYKYDITSLSIYNKFIYITLISFAKFYLK